MDDSSACYTATLSSWNIYVLLGLSTRSLVIRCLVPVHIYDTTAIAIGLEVLGGNSVTCLSVTSTVHYLARRRSYLATITLSSLLRL